MVFENSRCLANCCQRQAGALVVPKVLRLSFFSHFLRFLPPISLYHLAFFEIYRETVSFYCNTSLAAMVLHSFHYLASWRFLKFLLVRHFPMYQLLFPLIIASFLYFNLKLHCLVLLTHKNKYYFH